MTTRHPFSRRGLLRTSAGLAAAASFGAPAILHAETKTLKITTWRGKRCRGDGTGSENRTT